MALRGKAALAMWWEVGPQHAADFQHWHAHEHFPERLGIPGFLRATRWRETGGGTGVLVTYELADPSVLSSQAYLERLNAPTEWSTRMMPVHRNMVRSQCEVLESCGAYTVAHVLTVRLSPHADEQLRAALGNLIAQLPLRPGLNGAHLLRHRAPSITQTTEQKLRGGDRVADWVLLVSGYDLAVLQALARGELSAAALASQGAQEVDHGVYDLAVSAVPSDLRDVGGVTDPRASSPEPLMRQQPGCRCGNCFALIKRRLRVQASLGAGPPDRTGALAAAGGGDSRRSRLSPGRPATRARSAWRARVSDAAHGVRPVADDARHAGSHA
jgi:hypothetical protein